MIPTRKVALKKRVNKTQHRRTLQSPKVRKKVAVLRKGWTRLGAVQRGQRLYELAALGCSTRGLAEAFGKSPTNIRRHIMLAKLPDQYREAVQSGGSIKRILAQKADADRRQRQRERVNEDRQTGSLSGEAATLILEFCRTGRGPWKTPILPWDLPALFTSVKMNLLDFGLPRQRYSRAPKKSGWKALLKETRPTDYEDDRWLPHHGEWLANILSLKFPEQPIWERALEKADDRKKELVPVKKTQLASYNARLDRLAWISQGPAPRKRGSAYELERQGRK